MLGPFLRNLKSQKKNLYLQTILCIGIIISITLIRILYITHHRLSYFVKIVGGTEHFSLLVLVYVGAWFLLLKPIKEPYFLKILLN